MTLSKKQKVDLFYSLFSGREDVYARRWRKWDGSVSGYAPVYTDRQKMEYAPLTETAIEKHLAGTQTLGIYPMCDDNTSWFIVADFDGAHWFEDMQKFCETCSTQGLSAYPELSRSGNGAHVWCFFDQPYPAYKSRAVFEHLLHEASNVDRFDKNASFDRLFPSQDYLSGKGIGNLIALPLQGESRKRGATVFLDSINNYKAAEDQWQFLQTIKRTPCKVVDELYSSLGSESQDGRRHTKQRKQSTPSKSPSLIPLALANHITIPHEDLPPRVARFLREQLNFTNSQYIVKQRMGYSVYGIERFFNTVHSEGGAAHIPRGFYKHLASFLESEGFQYHLHDERTYKEKVKLCGEYSLTAYQQLAVDACVRQSHGILVAPPGSGKTVMGLDLIRRQKQPTLIITHRRQIYDQWLKRIEDFFGIPKQKIGQYGSTKKKVQYPVTVAMVQSLQRSYELDSLTDQFGCVIVDECHHMPARMFREVVSRLNPYYLYGLTATPKRSHNDEALMYAYLGDVIHTVESTNKDHTSKRADNTVIQRPEVRLTVHDTSFAFPFQPKTHDIHHITGPLIFDTTRNEQIVADVKSEAANGHTCLILTERKEHVEILDYYLGRDHETVTLTGDLGAKRRKHRERIIADGQFQILIATGQIFGEGSDVAGFDALFLVFPISSEAKLTQYIGRITRNESGVKHVYDYRDPKVTALEKLFTKRRRYYKRNGYVSRTFK